MQTESPLGFYKSSQIFLGFLFSSQLTYNLYLGRSEQQESHLHSGSKVDASTHSFGVFSMLTLVIQLRYQPPKARDTKHQVSEYTISR